MVFTESFTFTEYSADKSMKIVIIKDVKYTTSISAAYAYIQSDSLAGSDVISNSELTKNKAIYLHSTDGWVAA